MRQYLVAWIASKFCFFRQVIHEILPKLAKKRVDRLMEFCQDSQFKLEIVPSATEEYVDSLTFLDEIQEQVSCEIVVMLGTVTSKNFTGLMRVCHRAASSLLAS